MTSMEKLLLHKRLEGLEFNSKDKIFVTLLLIGQQYVTHSHTTCRIPKTLLKIWNGYFQFLGSHSYLLSSNKQAVPYSEGVNPPTPTILSTCLWVFLGKRVGRYFPPCPNPWPNPYAWLIKSRVVGNADSAFNRKMVFLLDSFSLSFI